MAHSLKFDVGMDNAEFMRGSRDIKRAIASLKSTVAIAGKNMSSAASGYGTAMRQSIQASRQFKQSVQDIRNKMNELQGSITSIKSAADEFRNLKSQISSSEEKLGGMLEQLKAMEDAGLGGASAAWKQNQEDIARVTAEIEKQRQAYYDYAAAVEYAETRLRKGTDEGGHRLTDEEKRTYDEEANYNVELANQAVERIEAAEAALESLKETQASLAANGEDGPAAEYQEMAAQISQAESEIVEMRNQLHDMRNAGHENADQSDLYKNQVEQLGILENELEVAQKKKEEALKPPYLQSWENMATISAMITEGFGRIENAASGAMYAISHPVQALDRALGTVIVKAGQAVSAFARMAGSAAISFLKRLASEARNAAIQMAKLTANAVTSGFKKIASGAAAATKGIINFTRSHKSSRNGLKTGLKTILKYAFGVRSMFFLFRRLRAAVTQAFNEMAKSSPELKTAMDSVQTALNGLKGSLATAFAPIYTAIAPALVYLINLLTSALNTIGAFMSALTGGTTFKKASGNMKATGKAAGGAAKKAKELKRELAGFDELNILNGDKNNGGGGGGGSGSGITYTTQAIPDGIKGFVDKLKELWANKEYVKIGKIIADWLNNAFEHAKELITWENVEEKIRGFVDAVTGILEGLFTYVNWELIGSTVSAGFRTVFNTINLLFKKRNLFTRAGLSLAAMINGFFKDPNLWTDLADTVTNAVLSFFAFGQAFLDGFDAETAGDSIYTALTSIKWGEIAESLWGVIKTAFNKAGSFINALLGGDQGEDNSELKQYARKRPTTIKPKYVVDDSVWDEVADTLTEGFNTVVEKLTTFISEHPITGVVGALADWLIKVKDGVSWEAVGTFIGTAFKGALDGIGTWITKWSGEAETIGNDIAGAINGFIDSAFAGDAIADYFTTAVKSAFSLVKGFVEKIDEEKTATEIKNAIEGVDWKGIAETAWEAFKDAVSKLGNFLTILFGGEAEYKVSGNNPTDELRAERMASSSGKRLKDPSGMLSAEGFGKSVSNAISAALDGIKGIIESVDWAGLGDEIGTVLASVDWKGVGTSIWQAFKEMFSDLITLITHALGGAGENGDAGKAVAAGVGALSLAKLMGAAGGALKTAMGAGGTAAGGGALSALGPFAAAVGLIGSGGAFAGFKISDMLQEKYKELIDEVNEKLPEIVSDYAGERKIEPGTEIDGWSGLVAYVTGGTDAAIKTSEALQKFIDAGFEKKDADIMAAALVAAQKKGEDGGEWAALGYINGLDLPEEQLEALRSAIETNTTAIENNPNAAPTLDDADSVFASLQQSVDANTEAVKESAASFPSPEELAEWSKRNGYDSGDSNVSGTVDIEVNNPDGSTTMVESGENLVDGLKTGVESKQGELDQSLVDAAEGMNTAFKDEEGISSPSTVFQEFGEFIVDGLILGLQTLPQALQGVWQALPQWAQALLGNSAGQFNLAISGGVSGNGGGTDSKDGKNSVKATKRQTKETKKLTKETKKNTEKRAEVDVNYEGAGFDTSGSKPVLNVGVNFAPEGEEPTDENKNSGLLTWLQSLFDKDTIEAKVELMREGWDSFKGWLKTNGMDENSPIGQLIDLVKNNFDTVMGFLGIDPKSPIGTALKLLLDNAENLLAFLGIDKNTPISTAIKLVLEKFKDIMDFLGIPKDSPIRTFIDLLLGNTDPEVDKAFDKDGSTISTFVNLVKQGFTTFLKFLGIDTDNPLIKTAIELIGQNFTSILGFLGLDPNNPLVQIFASLLKKDDKQTPGTLFGTLIGVLATLGKKNSGDTSGGLFGTLIGVLATLGKKNASDTSGGLFGTAISVLATLGKKNSGDTSGTLFGTLIGVLATLSKKNPEETSGGLFGTALTVLASVGYGKNVKKDSILALFGWSKKVEADKPKLATDVLKTGILDLFTWNKKPEADAPKRGTDVTKTGILDLFTWSKKPEANAPKRGTDVTKTGVLDLFTWNKKPEANAPKRGTDVTKSGVLDLFTWSKKPEANAPKKASGVKKGNVLDLFTWSKKPLADSPRRDSGVKKGNVLTLFDWSKKVSASGASKGGLSEDAVIDKFNWGRSIKAKKPTFATGVNKNSAANLFTKTVTITATLSSTIGGLSSFVSKIAKAVKEKLEQGATGGVITNGHLRRFASGGIIRGGMARYLDNVPHYAGGTNRAHGTVFVAGEAGPEILGHINGRTEILNKSQLAEAIYAAVVSGMGRAVNALGSYLANHMTNCTNSIVQTIGANAGISQLNGLDYYAPAMVTNGIMPYDVSMQIARSTAALQDTLDSNNEELIQAMVSAMGNAAQSIVQVLQRQMMQNSAGNNGLNVQQVTNAINRQTLMFGASPLKGV